MSKAPSQTATSIYHSPEYAEWLPLLSNWAPADGFQGTELRAEIRSQVLAHAITFQEAKKIAAEKISASIPDQAAPNENLPFVVSGHQPVVYHNGLLRKQYDLVRFAKESSGVAINIVIDTDAGNPGEITYPIKDTRSMLRRGNAMFASLANNGTLYKHAVVSTEARQVFETVSSQLSSGSYQFQRREVLNKYFLHASGIPWVVFNSVLREALEPETASLEIPLSVLCTIDAVQKYFRQLLSDPEKLYQSYNTALDAFRELHKIKNAANPFPNLKASGYERELPFWIVSETERRVLTFGDLKNLAPLVIVPRGALISYFFRTAIADLFIHGRGGETYDQFLPVFAEYFPSWPICPMTVSSETKLLFSDEAAIVSELEDFVAHKKDIISHTESYLQKMPSSLQQTLIPLVNRRAELLAQIKAELEDPARRAVLHELNAINADVRTTLEPWIEDKVSPLSTMNDEYKKTVSERTFPHWFF